MTHVCAPRFEGMAGRVIPMLVEAKDDQHTSRIDSMNHHGIDRAGNDWYLVCFVPTAIPLFSMNELNGGM